MHCERTPRIDCAGESDTARHSDWQRFLRGRYAPLLTHVSLLLMSVAYFASLLLFPFWIAFVPGVIVAHRIGVMLHEYIHGIPFRHYRSCLAVVSLFDGVLLLFGLLEVFRGTHLSHHAWLNREGDPAFGQAKKQASPARSAADWVSALEVVYHLKMLGRSIRGGIPFLKARRIALGAALSFATATVWVLVGRPDMIFKLIAISAFTAAVPVSLRGAIEHHSHPDDLGYANEYRVFIPLFNLNRHIHHHDEPRRPWYLLEFRRRAPLSEWHYFTHWFRAYIRKDFVLMKPMKGGQTLEPPRS